MEKVYKEFYKMGELLEILGIDDSDNSDNGIYNRLFCTDEFMIERECSDIDGEINWDLYKYNGLYIAQICKFNSCDYYTCLTSNKKSAYNFIREYKRIWG